MSADFYEIRQCPTCGLRYPLTANHPFGKRCPSCLGETEVVLKHAMSPFPDGEKTGMRGESHLSILLDNIRSAWNVGSIFRTADGLGINKLFLCGITPTPENESIQKTSLGAEETVTWDYSRNALETAKKLKTERFNLIALEQDSRAKPLDKIEKVSPQKTILIIGNEVTGVDPEILDLCDQIVHIPMHGQKQSLNVEVAFAIAAYSLLLVA
ncbi:MAG: RNA methyltransferase [Anaerolineales bacterium]|jgi:tRNA G18 (ribose-2'-O)-methylase SpoU